MRLPSIFIIFLDLGLGGVQRKIVDIVSFLAKSQKNLKIYILLRRKTDFNLANRIKNKNAKVLYYTFWLKKRIPLFFPFFVVYQAFKLKPKAILAFLPHASIAAILSKILLFWRKIRVVLSEDHYSSGVFHALSSGKLHTFGLKIFYPIADVIFSCSRACKEDLVKTFQIPSSKIRIIRNWTTFVTKEIKKRKKNFDLLYVGRLDKVKNVKFLLRAVKKLKNFKKDISLCLVGKGNEEEELKTYVTKNALLKNVKFMGPQDNVVSFYFKSRVFVFSPQKDTEGFPVAILEAMALGVPVLTNNFYGAGEVIKNKENGFIFSGQKDLVQKTLWLLKNPKEKNLVIKNAKEYVKKYHSPENIKVYLKELGI